MEDIITIIDFGRWQEIRDGEEIVWSMVGVSCHKDEFVNILSDWNDSTGEGVLKCMVGRKGGDICIHIADSLCCKAETNTTW